MTTSDQRKAGRALKGLSQTALAKAAGVSTMTVRRAEGAGKSFPSVDTIQALRIALEGAGVEFIEENGGGAGVRLKTRKARG